MRSTIRSLSDTFNWPGHSLVAIHGHSFIYWLVKISRYRSSFAYISMILVSLQDSFKFSKSSTTFHNLNFQLILTKQIRSLNDNFFTWNRSKTKICHILCHELKWKDKIKNKTQMTDRSRKNVDEWYLTIPKGMGHTRAETSFFSVVKSTARATALTSSPACILTHWQELNHQVTKFKYNATSILDRNWMKTQHIGSIFFSVNGE